MLIPLKITTDYSLLKSTITIDSLIDFLKEKNISTCAIVDENLYGVMEFYNKCIENNIKPIIGLEITLNHLPIYLYSKDYVGYQNLLKIHTLVMEKEISIVELELYKKNILCVLPYATYSYYKELSSIYEIVYLAYQNELEKTHALLQSKNIVYLNDIHSLKKEDTLYLDYLNMIRTDTKAKDYQLKEYENNYYHENDNESDQKTTKEFSDLITICIPKNENYIPSYNAEIKDRYAYLKNLTEKGLKKRLNNQVTDEYEKRLEYELSVINKMGFVDYILIVYDYVLFAKKNHIYVGPGRGSAVGSLVCYTLGITDIDPLKYHLLFERFLNPERVTMPDIDIDFDNLRRGEVIEYIKQRYGEKKVASIMTFATLKSKLALREIARIVEIEDGHFEQLLKEIEPNKNLKENLEKEKVKNMLKNNSSLQKVYKLAMKIEGFKKNISTHAAGIVISRVNLDDVIPILKVGNSISTGITMEYLEELGLLKMDLLAIKNLYILSSTLDLILKDTGKHLNINKINLEDAEVLKLFSDANTTGIFQFESMGMRSFLQKVKPTKFSDLVAVIALYRPGPMDNLSTFVRRKEKKEKVTYLLPELEPILKETQGIIVYQEQVMQILVEIGGYRFSEADIIRRAMSKKKKEIIEQERVKFINGALQKGYPKQKIEELYDLILKFAGYGFNKSHSVSYALIGYQMAYLKVKFPMYFMTNLLNLSIGSEIKTKEYLREAKKLDLEIVHPSINKSEKEYKIIESQLILPFSIVKGLSSHFIEDLLKEREKGLFTDFIDFVSRMKPYSITTKMVESLIYAGILEEFGNMTTLLKNIPAVFNYAELVSSVDSPLLLKPVLEQYPMEENVNQKELESYGFYITNHPTSIYNDSNIMKLKNIKNYFDKQVRCVVLIESIKRLKTKNNEEMAFVEASDETNASTFVVFHKQIGLLENLKVKDIAEIQGRVTKRFDKYQVNVNNIIKK